MFNVVPQWHPLRLAEDFALADLLTGGRMVFGVGRGTVPREAESLGVEDEIVSNGSDEVLGNFDMDRLQTLIDESVPIFETAGVDSIKADLTAEDVATNEFIDDSIGLP
jgi:alkanesulfonate monooxygenase SsuD/methylene tetrahydromethanopterin reductase-like flavin-dependent oxidoreductase (luciferase family)